MNNPFEYVPGEECRRAFGELLKRIEEMKRRGNRDDVAPECNDKIQSGKDGGNAAFCRELEAGKMLGVMIAADAAGVRHTLYAFSGQVGEGEFHREGFVGPVFDYLEPDGHFKRRGADISRLNREITQLERGEYAAAAVELQQKEREYGSAVTEYREKCRRSKAARDARRKAMRVERSVEGRNDDCQDRGFGDDAENQAMIRQSQFEKAELRRIKRRVREMLEPYRSRFEAVRSRLQAKKEQRRRESEELQQWLFGNFKVLNARGEEKSLSEIFAETSMAVPPSGAGECCAPKLLQAAYLRGWTPVAMAEYWYGRPKDGELRIHGMHYPACRGKCLPVLGWMLQGLEVDPPMKPQIKSMCGCRHGNNPEDNPENNEEDPGNHYKGDLLKRPEIIYENQWFCVIEKPAGMLSVPGKEAGKSLEEWLAERYRGRKEYIRMAHRLDQATSGLIIAAFSELAYKLLQRLFAMGKVRKTYVADLEGDYRERGLPEKGRINLPLSADYMDRPRQKVDYENGKPSATDYEFQRVVVGVTEGRSRIIFHPLSGRTHQLRVHSASEAGLGMPIVGDRLYGGPSAHCESRLHLHACRIEFRFPVNKESYIFESAVPF